MSDHQRGCEGRTYTCTCGYDAALEARAEAAEAQMARLRKALEACQEEVMVQSSGYVRNVYMICKAALED